MGTSWAMARRGVEVAGAVAVEGVEVAVAEEGAGAGAGAGDEEGVEGIECFV